MEVRGTVHEASLICDSTLSARQIDAFDKYCKLLRKDPENGKNKFSVVQAEDELAAIGMAIGAGWNGARAFTASSGPGVSLMQEFLGLAYFSEVPVVLFDIQRVGPSTGMKFFKPRTIYAVFSPDLSDVIN